MRIGIEIVFFQFKLKLVVVLPQIMEGRNEGPNLRQRCRNSCSISLHSKKRNKKQIKTNVDNCSNTDEVS